MGSEDFSHLVLENNKTVTDYIDVGIVNQLLFDKTIKEGKKFPFFYHAGDYVVDLASIPLGTEIGATALFAAFKNN